MKRRGTVRRMASIPQHEPPEGAHMNYCRCTRAEAAGITQDPWHTQPHPQPATLVTIDSDPFVGETPVAAIQSWVTPNALYYARNHFENPSIEPADWSLVIDGEVTNPSALSLSDIRALPAAYDPRDDGVRGQQPRRPRPAGHGQPVPRRGRKHGDLDRRGAAGRARGGRPDRRGRRGAVRGRRLGRARAGAAHGLRAEPAAGRRHGPRHAAGVRDERRAAAR